MKQGSQANKAKPTMGSNSKADNSCFGVWFTHLFGLWNCFFNKAREPEPKPAISIPAYSQLSKSFVRAWEDDHSFLGKADEDRHKQMVIHTRHVIKTCRGTKTFLTLLLNYKIKL